MRVRWRSGWARRGAIVMLCLACLPAAARNIRWFCDSGGSKQFSDGMALDATIRFEVGVFTGGFTPTLANRSEWADHWVAAQRESYYVPTTVFSGTVNVTGNEAPFAVGSRGYIWGFTGDLEDGEWILVSDPAWTWPPPDPFNPSDLFWNIGLAGEVKAGTVHSSGTPFLLQTEVVAMSVPPPTTWAQWLAEELSGETEDGPDDDPDGDGRSNLEEYAAGTPPLAALPAASVSPAMVVLGEDRYAGVMVPLRTDRDVGIEIGLSTDLVTWDYAPSATVMVGETTSSVSYRSVTPMAGQPSLFLRARFTVPE